MCFSCYSPRALIHKLEAFIGQPLASLYEDGFFQRMLISGAYIWCLLCTFDSHMRTKQRVPGALHAAAQIMDRLLDLAECLDRTTMQDTAGQLFLGRRIRGPAYRPRGEPAESVVFSEG